LREAIFLGTAGISKLGKWKINL